MAAVIALGAALAFAIAAALGSGERTAGLAAAVVGAGSLISLAPGLLRLRAEHWGLAVMGASAARMLMVLAIGLAADPAGAGRRGFWMGLVAGAVAVLIAETALAVTTLQRIERDNRSRPGGGAAAGGERAQA